MSPRRGVRQASVQFLSRPLAPTACSHPLLTSFPFPTSPTHALGFQEGQCCMPLALAFQLITTRFPRY